MLGEPVGFRLCEVIVSDIDEQFCSTDWAEEESMQAIHFNASVSSVAPA
jgi:hypothetical protein